MDKHTFQRLLRLASKTGSPVIVTDQEGVEPAVLMPLNTYEVMLEGLMFDGDLPDEDFDLYEEDEIGQDIGIPMQEIDQDIPFEGEEAPSLEDIVLQDVPFDPPIPEPPQQEQKKPEEDLGEERFYLEPIE